MDFQVRENNHFDHFDLHEHEDDMLWAGQLHRSLLSKLILGQADGYLEFSTITLCPLLPPPKTT